MANLEKAVRLAEDRRFAEAAEVALACATQIKARQPVSQFLYEAYGAAGKFYHLADQPVPALDAFDRCFEVFDRILAGQANPLFVTQHLATWPELFTRAALAALDAGKPAAAVEYAETGRARLTGRLSRSRLPPPEVEPGVWGEYVANWRRTASHLTDARLRGAGVTEDDRVRIAEVERQHRELCGRGVPRDALYPVSPTVPVARLVEALAAPGRTRTVILYAITLDDDTLRTVRISAEGAHEVEISVADQSSILRAAIGFGAAIREVRSGTALDRALEDLLDRAGGGLARLLDGALGEDPPERLVWVPHGSLVVVPLTPVPFRGQHLACRLAVQVAPSLSMVARGLAGGEAHAGEPVAIEGRQDRGKAPTAGGDTLLRELQVRPTAPARPHTLEDLRSALENRPLALFTCHGMFDWDRPLASYLELDFDCDLDALASPGLFPVGAVVLLNTCDAGTVSQDATNEPIGIPIAMMAGGAETVLGPSQPVGVLAGVTFCALVIRALAEGSPSPEAARRAITEMQSMTWEGIGKLLDELEHPLASQLPRTRPAAPAFRERADWAFFQHWGGALQPVPDETR